MFEVPESIPSVNASGGQSGATYRGNHALAAWGRKYPAQASRLATFTAMLDRQNARASAAFDAGQASVGAKQDAGEAIALHDEFDREHGSTPERAEVRKRLVAARDEATQRQAAAQQASHLANRERCAVRDAVNAMTAKANELAVADAKPRTVAPKLPSGAAGDVFANAIEKRAALKQDGARIAAAVDAKDDAHRMIVDQVMRLGDEGRAGLRVTLGGRRGPRLHLPVEVVAAEPTGDAVPTATDAGALIAALFPEQFERAALEALDRAYASKGLVALDAEAKAKALAKLDSEVLGQERIIAEAALAAAQRNFDVPLPADISPMALLGIE